MARSPKGQNNNPKRRIAKVADVSDTDVEEILAASRYSGSAHHKKHPEVYGFQPGPRKAKSFCDDKRVVSPDEAGDLLSRGIRRRMVSEYRKECLPKFVWAVDDHGEAFEAKLGRDGYHGYRLGDRARRMRDRVKKEWEKRND